MNKKVYIVTGAAGFLGSAICRQLDERGDKVRAFVLPNDKSDEFLPQRTEVVRGDLTDLNSLNTLFNVPEDTDVIVMHIASIVAMNPEYSQKVMDVNVGGTKNIIHQCLTHANVKKLVYCSSTGAIPELTKGNKIKEVDSFDENLVLGCYSKSKALATQAVLDAVKNDNLNACVIHPSGILGPDDYAVGETTRALIQILHGELSAGISGSFNLCDVRDLAFGAIQAADKGRKGECYILGNETVTFKEFSNMIADEAVAKRIKFFLPASIAMSVANHAEKKAKKNGTKPVMTTFSVYNLARNNDFDSTKAFKELGYMTRPYSETIHDEVVWLRETGKLS